jgi:hypothetical protein
MCKSPKPNGRLNCSLLMTSKSCGHRIVTERSISETQQATISVLYELGMRGLVAGFTPIQLNEEWANDLSISLNTSYSPQTGDSLADETSGDIADQLTGALSCFQTGEYIQRSVTNRRRKSHQGDDVIRYMYFSYPSPDGRCLSELTVRTKDDRPTDRVLIESLKKEYNSLRPYYMRLRSLRGFSAIRLARVCATVISFRGANTDMCQFKYYVMIDSKIPKAVD